MNRRLRTYVRSPLLRYIYFIYLFFSIREKMKSFLRVCARGLNEILIICDPSLAREYVYHPLTFDLDGLDVDQYEGHIQRDDD